jgi:hypothetical protein
MTSRCGLFCGLLVATAPLALAETHPSVPAFNSLLGAPYTIYLDFAGFNFPDGWGFGAAPGNVPAYHFDGDPSTFTFSSTELANIQNVWSRVAEKYAPFNVNVTTVDPAPAVTNDLPTTDAQRTDYYDNQAAMMHTIIGGGNDWLDPNSAGISQLGATAAPQFGTNGYHTNFVFSALSPSNLLFIGEAAAHENGHGLGLSHQSDYSVTPFLEYSLGTTPQSGPGSKAPTMGNSYFAERGTWTIGTAHNQILGQVIQNDPQTILDPIQNPGMGSFINDGIGHSRGSATPLPINGGHVDSSHAKGVIVPASSSNPVPTGESNYVADFWSFTTAKALVTLTANAGPFPITPGVADPGAMLDSTLRILDANGVTIAESATINLSETLSLSLGMGTYYAEVVSAGDPDRDNLGFSDGFFDMGSYFLSGDFIPVAVPEPSTFALLAVGLVLAAFGIRRRRRG